MIVSVNDIPEMHEAFSGLAMTQLETHYNDGGVKRGKIPSSELLIFNFA